MQEISSIAPEAEAILKLLTLSYGEPVEMVRTKWGHPLVLLSDANAFYIGCDASGAARVRLERERLHWAQLVGISVPEVVDAGEGWLVTCRVPRDDPRGREYVERSLEVAAQIRGALPPRASQGGLSSRRPSRRGIAQRIAAIAVSPLSVAEFVTARRRAARVPSDHLAHADFHPYNVLYDAGAGKVIVIDWQHLGFYPKWTDELVFWTQLQERADRDLLLDFLVETETNLEHLAALLHWLAVRAVADVVTERGPRDPADGRLRTSLERLEEAKAVIRDWGASGA